MPQQWRASGRLCIVDAAGRKARAAEHRYAVGEISDSEKKYLTGREGGREPYRIDPYYSAMIAIVAPHARGPTASMCATPIALRDADRPNLQAREGAGAGAGAGKPDRHEWTHARAHRQTHMLAHKNVHMYNHTHSVTQPGYTDCELACTVPD